MEQEEDRYIHISKHKLFLLVKLFKEESKRIEPHTQKAIIKKHRCNVIANFCNELLDHNGIDELVNRKQKEADGFDYKKRLAEAIQTEED